MKKLKLLINFFTICLFLSIGTHIVKAQDSDSDGITDVSDLDDDNDGVPDAEESPDCFYTVYEANRIVSVISPLNGGVGDPAAGTNIPLLYNDNTNDGTTLTAYNFAALQAITSGSAIFTVQYPTPVILKSVAVTQAANGMAGSGFAKLYGSNDGIGYTLLTTGAGISIAGTNPVFTNTSTTPYLYYQIRYIGTVSAGNATSVTAGTAAIHEISSLLSTTTVYTPSAHPKSGICSVDTDGDGTPNHLDTDSDGDTCPDAYEGGATSNKTISVLPAPYGTNGLANAVETSADSGQVSYVSTYAKYANNNNQNLCIDTDNDGVPNPIDIDDDNDGVLDTSEGDFCGKINRNIRVGYLASGVGDNGLATNLLLNLNNFGSHGTYNKTTGITLVPFATEASITEASLLANTIDVFFVGSSANDATTSADKVSTALNTRLITWAQNNSKSIFALQNNAIDYGYTITNNNVNPNTPSGTIGTNTYTNGYWPTSSLNQSGAIQMTIQSSTRPFDILMTDANLRPVVITDRGYNLLIFPDATIYNTESGMVTPTTNDQKAIADTWTYFFDRFVAPQCTTVDTDGDSTPNHLDLDSDGDGCSDALESGATTSLTPNFAFTSAAGTATDTNSDGLADIVDANTNRIPDYLSTYDPHALDNTIRKCLDSDGDILPDAADMDDDNDGILDTNEGNTCSGLGRNLRIGYLNTTVGTTGLMMNMLSNTANFSSTGTYNKFSGITFVPYATEAAITEAQLLANNIDVFYVGSSATDAQTSVDKLSTAVNTRILSWSDNNNKGVIVMQNNATDYGYQITNNNLNTDVPYGSIGDAVFTNGYWPENTFNQSGTVQMTIASLTRTYETAMVDANGKAVFARDADRKIVFIPDATSFSGANQTASTITNAELRIAADVWAYSFDVFLDGQQTCTTIDTDGDGIPNHLDLDSDNDGCLDALEGTANITLSQLVNAGGSLSVGTGSSASNQNLCAGSVCVDINGIPTIVGNTGQGIGDSQNASVSSGCFCYKPATLTGTVLDTKYGITALGRAGVNSGNWPMVRKGAWTALEAKTKGFVVNRIPTTAQVNAIAIPVEGMMVYDEEADCLKIYTTVDNGMTFSWQCFNTQACPDY
ncbi:hypothetical protein HHL23_18595 [Chryseobacterium sp. RP-3-3]|uniref:Thrombospondin type 3 repeat-containing protein n=1 Tax=Chryseobacterium antibioticum TaxID=2728847 RepID=A0A7Y0FT17_9FLAO|nr:hypothetical protein [Chryseobacterium antibioticum]NML71788.1 hypothetical protein [Chryseobacterium antibioticum]